MQNDCFLIDWLSFRCVSMDWYGIAEYLGLSDCNWEDGNGFYGYRFRKWCSGISIHYGNDSVEGVLVEMSGTGCRAFETFATEEMFLPDGQKLRVPTVDWLEIFHDILTDDDFVITRLDIAFDDREGSIPMKRLFRDIGCENFVSRFKVPEGVTREDHPGEVGQTIYLGSPKSEIRFRIYDKAFERGYTDGSHWIRFECMLRRERALNFLQQLVDSNYDIGNLFASVVENYFRVVTPPKDKTDTNKRRWATAPYWQRLIGDVLPVSLWSKKDLEYNKYYCESYVYGQAGNSVAALIELDGLEKFYSNLQKRKSKKIPKRISNMISTEKALQEKKKDETD